MAPHRYANWPGLWGWGRPLNDLQWGLITVVWCGNDLFPLSREQRYCATSLVHTDGPKWRFYCVIRIHVVEILPVDSNHHVAGKDMCGW
jgi:hypothetical protein